MAFSTPRITTSLPRKLLWSCAQSSMDGYVVATSSVLSKDPVCMSRRKLSSTRQAAEENRPRWSYTPPEMKGKFRLNPIRYPQRTVWKVNEDPDKLDTMYKRFLGPRGEELLPDEIKWLAVTHKSFDQGRRGFNDRIAYLGMSLPLTSTM